MMEIDDLQASSDLPLAPLSIKVWLSSRHHVSAVEFCDSDYVILCFWIQDPRDYFDSQQATALKNSRDTSIGTDPVKRILSAEESYASLRDSISLIKTTGLVDPIIKPEVAVKVIYFIF